MADDITLNSGSGGDTLAADDIAGVKYQRVKISVGADGAAADNSTAAPLAVKISDGTDVATVTAGGLLQVDASGATVPVSGTVTAELSATDNAVLDAIAASVAAIDADATTIIGHVDGIEALLGTMDADTSALAGAVSGTEVQVDIVAALPAGTNAIGKLAANSGVDIGDVDVTSVVPGTGATNLGKAEDAAHASGDTGVMALTVRTNTAASRAGTDGDYQPLITDTNGRLHTIEPSQANILTAVQLIDNASVNHDATVVSGVTQIGLAARSAAPTAVATGDATRALATLLGKQIVYPHALPAETWQYAGPTGGITDTADDAIQAAGGAGVRHYLTALTVVNSHATVGTEVVIKDGSTVIHRGYAAAAGGGYTLTFPTPLRGTAATALNVACITTGSATVVSASGFSAAE